MKKILGISAFYHDSAAALTIDGKTMAAVQEERFTRRKHTPDFPVKAIEYCLRETGLGLDDLDAVVFYDKPLLKLERILETYYAFAPRGFRSFIKSAPIWFKEKIFLKKVIYDFLKEIENYDRKKMKLLFSEHHLSHAASTFFPSPHDQAAILTIDGVGEWSTASIGKGEGNKITILKEMNFPHSVGLFYSAFTYYLGFAVNSGEYKLMGLAPYGNPQSPQTNDFIQKIKNELTDIKKDGSIWLNQSCFDYTTGLTMVNDKRWERLFGFPRRIPESRIKQHHCNLALAAQKITEEIVLKMACEAKNITGEENLCLAGGVALNCVANGNLARENIFRDIYIQPAAGDAGGALGAALSANFIYFNEERRTLEKSDQMSGAFLGPEYSEEQVRKMNSEFKTVCTRYDDPEKLMKDTADKLAQGFVIGWFQGRMEFGPRALGNRSILGDARDPEMQKKINLKIKFREGFRPFAPSVLAEDTGEYFDPASNSPYMLVTSFVKENRRITLPDNFHDRSLDDKLYYRRSDIPAVTHLDYSARVQTVSREVNRLYWELLNAFKNITGCSVLINTSFNVRGEPIVCTPYDAYRCFMATDMDYLVINNFVYCKIEQPDRENKGKWATKFGTD